jgi:hypothetical protein
MVFRVKVVDGQYCILLSPEAMAEMRLKEGSVVEVSAVESGNEYISLERALASYLETLPLHRNTYRELAKGPGGNEYDGGSRG